MPRHVPEWGFPSTQSLHLLLCVGQELSIYIHEVKLPIMRRTSAFKQYMQSEAAGEVKGDERNGRGGFRIQLA